MTQDVKKTLQISALSVFFVILLGYALFRSYDLVFGIKIKNVNITDGTNYADSILHISGNAKNANKLSLNGRIISINQDGDFTETVALLSGYNLINIEAEDKFGNKDEKNYQLTH